MARDNAENIYILWSSIWPCEISIERVVILVSEALMSQESDSDAEHSLPSNDEEEEEEEEQRKMAGV